jgi:hypothetical protein
VGLANLGSESKTCVGSCVRLARVSISLEKNFYRLPFTPTLSGSPYRSFRDEGRRQESWLAAEVCGDRRRLNVAAALRCPVCDGKECVGFGATRTSSWRCRFAPGDGETTATPAASSVAPAVALRSKGAAALGEER